MTNNNNNEMRTEEEYPFESVYYSYKIQSNKVHSCKM